MKSLFFGYVILIGSISMFASSAFAGTITFGSVGNQFDMEFVTIGNPGNPADNTGNPNPAGSVGYSYGIAKYEVSEQMVQVYNNLGPVPINKSSRGPKKPVTGVSWNEASRFVNWLNTSKGFTPAYKFTSTGLTADDSRHIQISLWDPTDTLDYDPANRIRSKRAIFALPSYNEWYKAAYYDPETGTYFDYPTGSNTAPSITTGGNGQNTAVYSTSGPADVDFAGGVSAYDVMALGGNAFEHEESTFDLLNLSAAQVRGVRGGWWGGNVAELSSSIRYAWEAGHRDFPLGFRVVQLSGSPAAVPEPTSMAIFGLGALGMAYRARRKAKA